jgi:phosphoserine aminotransferase
MAIPANYKVLFLHGGASLQFAMVPLNPLGARTSADYVNTGEWSKKAIKEARFFFKPNVIASSEDRGFTYAPALEEWKLNNDAAYFHYTANETIGGVEFHWTPETGDLPLVCDMSSNILSKPVDVARYGLIYAGAQKISVRPGLP